MSPLLKAARRHGAAHARFSPSYTTAAKNATPSLPAWGKASKAEIKAGFYEYLTGVLTQEEAAAFAAMPDRLYTASKKESRAGFPHFQKPAGGEADEEA